MTMPAALAAELDANPTSPPADKLDRLQQACSLLRDKKQELSDLAERQAAVEAAINKLERTQLPDLMDEAGTDRIAVLARGNLPTMDARMEPYFHANIAAEVKPGSDKGWPAERRAAAFDALIAEDAGDLIRHTVTVTFGRGQEEEAHALGELLRGEGYTFTVAQAVPWASLTAWVKERHNGDRPLSGAVLDKIGAVVGRIVRLKPRKG
jgi:hypothetical protein